MLDALQELTRLAVQRETGERSRLMLDVGGYRAGRASELDRARRREAAEDATASGEPVALEPMTPFERKIVHDAVAAAGLRSESEGEEPQRHVVVLPALTTPSDRAVSRETGPAAGVDEHVSGAPLSSASPAAATR